MIDLEQVRADTPGVGAGHHLDNAGSALAPALVGFIRWLKARLQGRRGQHQELLVDEVRVAEMSWVDRPITETA